MFMGFLTFVRNDSREWVLRMTLVDWVLGNISIDKISPCGLAPLVEIRDVLRIKILSYKAKKHSQGVFFLFLASLRTAPPLSAAKANWLLYAPLFRASLDHSMEAAPRAAEACL